MHRAALEFGRLLAVWLVVAAAGLPAGTAPVRAQQSAVEDIFVVRGIRLDETAETAAAARARALVEGQRIAFARLMERLTRSIHRGRIDAPDAQTLRFLVDALQIDDEKTSDVRYLASLTVAFKPEAVRGFLRSAKVPFAEVRSRPALIIPVLDTPAGYVLWDDPNPWRQAWRGRAPGTGLVPVITPIGDLADFTDLDADQAAAGDQEAIDRLAERYGVAAALVVIALIREVEPRIDRIDITGKRAGAGGAVLLTMSLRSRLGESRGDFLSRSVAAVVETLTDEWKAANALAPGEASVLRAAVPVRDLAAWIEIRDRMGRVPAVSRVRLIALTAAAAEIEIRHLGDRARLERAFERFDLALEEAASDAPPSSANASPTHVVRLIGG